MAAKSLYFMLPMLICGLTGCADGPPLNYEAPRRHYTNAAQQAYAEKEFAVYDPAESVNKGIYDFNARLDMYLFLPIVDAYTYVTPPFVRRGVSNFFLNVGEVNNFTNAVLQANITKASTTLGRFAVNTTVGLLGTFDVATDMGLERKPEDFGRTLGRWGAGPGAYVVLPVLGPSNVRDTLGQLVDYATLYFLVPNRVQNSTGYEIIAYGVEPVNLRYSNSFRYYASASPFEYELVRYIVTQLREQQISKLQQ